MLVPGAAMSTDGMATGMTTPVAGFQKPLGPYPDAGVREAYGGEVVSEVRPPTMIELNVMPSAPGVGSAVLPLLPAPKTTALPDWLANASMKRAFGRLLSRTEAVPKLVVTTSVVRPSTPPTNAV